MSQSKQAYFQGGGGVNEPAPKEKKYKSEKAIVVQPRFKEPLYRNYDLYNVPGKHGPGAGWHDMQKYKSVSDFLKDKRKKLKDKYKADDSWIEEELPTKKERKDKIKTRAALLSKITKVAIDYPIDDQINSGPILGDSESYNSPIQLGPTGDPDTSIYPVETNLGNSESYPNSVQIGGLLDKYLPNNDFEGKSPDKLDFGRAYVEDAKTGLLDEESLHKIMNKYLTTGQTGLYGLPDGVNAPDEDLGDPTNINLDYGTTDLGITMYEDKWNI